MFRRRARRAYEFASVVRQLPIHGVGSRFFARRGRHWRQFRACSRVTLFAQWIFIVCQFRAFCRVTLFTRFVAVNPRARGCYSVRLTRRVDVLASTSASACECSGGISCQRQRPDLGQRRGAIFVKTGSSIGISARAFVGSRYLLNGLAEPMNFVCVSAAAPECGAQRK